MRKALVQRVFVMGRLDSRSNKAIDGTTHGGSMPMIARRKSRVDHPPRILTPIPIRMTSVTESKRCIRVRIDRRVEPRCGVVCRLQRPSFRYESEEESGSVCVVVIRNRRASGSDVRILRPCLPSGRPFMMTRRSIIRSIIRSIMRRRRRKRSIIRKRRKTRRTRRKTRKRRRRRKRRRKSIMRRTGIIRRTRKTRRARASNHSSLYAPPCCHTILTKMFLFCSKCSKLVRKCNTEKHAKKCKEGLFKCCDCGQEMKQEDIANHTSCSNAIRSTRPSLFNPNSVFSFLLF